MIDEVIGMLMKRFVFALIMALSLCENGVHADDGHGAQSLGVKIEELVKSTHEWNGQLLPSYPSGQPEIKVLRIKIPAGITLPWHYHPAINAAVILEGHLQLFARSGVTKIFGPGEALVEVVHTVHAGKAIGPDDVEIIVFYAGRKGSPTTVLSE